MSRCRRIVSLVVLALTVPSAFPHVAGATECATEILFGSRRTYRNSGELAASSSASDPYPQRRVGSVEVGPFGIRTYALCENTGQTSNGLTIPAVTGTLILHEVVFSSAGSAPVPVSLNLDLDGRFELLDQTDRYALGKIVVSAVINGTAFPGEIHVCTRYCVEIQTGLLEGVLGSNYPDLRLTTPEVTVPVNEPVTVAISMKLTLAADAAPWSKVEAFFDNTFAFAQAGPVFNVPAGVTVNSEHGLIVDNVYTADNSVLTTPSTWSRIKARYR